MPPIIRIRESYGAAFVQPNLFWIGAVFACPQSKPAFPRCWNSSFYCLSVCYRFKIQFRPSSVCSHAQLIISGTETGNFCKINRHTLVCVNLHPISITMDVRARKRYRRAVLSLDPIYLFYFFQLNPVQVAIFTIAFNSNLKLVIGSQCQNIPAVFLKHSAFAPHPLAVRGSIPITVNLTANCSDFLTIRLYKSLKGISIQSGRNQIIPRRKSLNLIQVKSHILIWLKLYPGGIVSIIFDSAISTSIIFQ